MKWVWKEGMFGLCWWFVSSPANRNIQSDFFSCASCCLSNKTLPVVFPQRTCWCPAPVTGLLHSGICPRSARLSSWRWLNSASQVNNNPSEMKGRINFNICYVVCVTGPQWLGDICVSQCWQEVGGLCLQGMITVLCHCQAVKLIWSELIELLRSC